MSKPRRQATCHPDRPHKSLGLCSACVQRKAYHADIEASREKTRIRNRNSYKKNPERFKESDDRFKVNSTRSFVLSRAKTRARRAGLLCEISKEDIHIPDVCPLLGIKLEFGKRGEGRKGTSPSLDRKDSTKGYVKGNVWVISDRANTIKNSASFEEFERIYLMWKAARG